ncbi:acyltransferase [Gracilimonas amylolytica]|uniref:acyltransferase n=1 Tax=Gracilimonas amylolytica TaxID=1749045 RepID=UPI000CD9EFAC|nr:acyltransferase [Gracilimonas amylolytica]
MSTENRHTDQNLATKLSKRLASKNSWLLNRVGKSLERDKNYPLSYLIHKGFSFMYNILVSRVYLRKVDSVGKHPRVEKKPYLVNLGQMKLGDNVNICSRSVACDLVSYPEGLLEMGDDVFVNFGTTICAENKVSIGDRVKIGPYCMIHDTDFHVPGKDFTTAKGIPIIIEDDVWLSSRVLVMKGSVIGRGSVIAAGSVVSGVIPPNVIAGGVPAKVIKKISPNDFEEATSKNDSAIDCRIKNKIDGIIRSVTGTDAHELPHHTSVSSIDNWSADNHLKILKSIENEFLFESHESGYLKLNTLQKIYQWTAGSVSDSVKSTYVMNK